MNLLDGLGAALRDAAGAERPADPVDGVPAAAAVALGNPSEGLDPLAIQVAERLHSGRTPGWPAPQHRRQLVAATGARVAADDVVIGRGAQVGLLVEGDIVSRCHCSVSAGAVRDLGSANGTVILRGQLVIPVGDEPVVLEPGDELMTDRGRARLARFV